MKLKELKNVPLQRSREIDSLDLMFDLKVRFMEMLKPIEDLTNYPLDLDKKENQLIIKDFIGRITEEYFEGLEVLQMILPMQMEPFISQEAEPVIEELFYDLTEEQADVMHFMVELLILCGVTPDDIRGYYSKMAEKVNIDIEVISGDSLDIIMYLERTNNILEGNYAGSKNIYLFQTKLSKDFRNSLEPVLGAGLFFNYTNYLAYQTCSFELLKFLNCIRTKLKRKQWRDNQEVSDLAMVRGFALEAFHFMMANFDLIGHNPTSNALSYVKKDSINITRLQEKLGK